MKRILLPMLVLGILGGCETMGVSDKGATIEERGDTKTGTAADGAATTGVDGRGVSGTTMAADDPRNDPANLLSKRSVYFDFDQFVIKDEYRSMVDAHAAYLNSHRDARITIQGNADERGSREYNLALGHKRADAVRKALAVSGVRDGQMEAISFGEEKPRRTGTTEADYAENRRADIVYGDE